MDVPPAIGEKRGPPFPKPKGKATQEIFSNRMRHPPFGGERAYTEAWSPLFKFEGKIRDYQTGNDDFGARYYSNRFGRWLSADWSNVPAPVPYANLSNPQTLNLYSMVADDPESFADLDGHQCQGQDYPNGPGNKCPHETADRNTEAANSNAARGAQGAATSVGTQATQDASVRARYVEAVRQLDPGDSAGRTALKTEARAASSPGSQVIAETMRPIAEEASRLGGTVTKTNASVDAALGAAGKAGPALMAVGVAMSAYNVATADNKPRAVAREGGAWAGALSFGGLGAVGGAKAGAIVGSFFGGVGAVPGAAIGGLVGALGGGVVGAIVGGKAGTNIYDLFH